MRTSGTRPTVRMNTNLRETITEYAQVGRNRAEVGDNAASWAMMAAEQKVRALTPSGLIRGHCMKRPWRDGPAPTTADVSAIFSPAHLSRPGMGPARGPPAGVGGPRPH